MPGSVCVFHSNGKTTLANITGTRNLVRTSPLAPRVLQIFKASKPSKTSEPLNPVMEMMPALQ